MKAMAAMISGTKQCHLRSLKCLELHPAPNMAIADGAYRVTVIRAILALCQACNSKSWSQSMAHGILQSPIKYMAWLLWPEYISLP